MQQNIPKYHLKYPKKNIRGLSPRADYTDRVTPLAGEVSANFCG
jgi:hypothetical protein